MEQLINDYNAIYKYSFERVFYLSRINAYVSNRELNKKEATLYTNFLKTFE
jgi:hypothetical protein